MSATASEREALRAMAREVLERHSSPERVQRIVAQPQEIDESLWALMSQLGWPGVGLPEEAGGLGYGVAEEAILVEEMGSHLTGSPLVPTAIASAGLLAGGSGHLPLLEHVAAGALPLSTSLAAVTDPGAGVTAHDDGDATVLNGSAGLVWEAVSAGGLVVVATDGNGELAVGYVRRDAAGLQVTPEQPVDRTRRLATVAFNAVAVTPEALLGRGPAARSIVERMLDRAALHLALDSLGGTQRLLELTLAYVKERVQFGRAIGSFQVIKHRCADMLVAAEASRSMVDCAISALNGADEGRGAAMASAAKAYCADAYAAVAGDALQTHGGIGFTWENEVQLHLKRAKLNQQLCGSASWHRARAAEILFGERR
jgi:alkylation response protein AidB-like acyl-CoA dehydrogenase